MLCYYICLNSFLGTWHLDLHGNACLILIFYHKHVARKPVVSKTQTNLLQMLVRILNVYMKPVYIYRRIQRRGQGIQTPTPKILQKYRVSLLNWSGSPKKHKATKPSILGHHQPASETPFKWCLAVGLMMAYL